MSVKGLFYELNKDYNKNSSQQFTRLFRQGFSENFTYNMKKKEIPMKLVNQF